MKQPDYRLIILFIIFTSTLFIGAALYMLRPAPEEAAITVNKKTVSLNDFNRMFQKKSYIQNRNSFIHSLVVKELLVQEALKSGIQNEKAFIDSVRDHYEQTLVKLTIDRKYETVDSRIDDSLVDRYIALSDKVIDISVLDYASIPDFKNGKPLKEESLSLPFNRLSLEVKYELLTLREGQTSKPSCSDSENDCSVFRVNKIRSDQVKTDKEEDREAIRQLLAEQKKEWMISEWLENLKKKADISLGQTVSNNTK